MAEEDCRMNYSNAGFRFFYHRFVVFDKSFISGHKDDYHAYDQADGILAYGYIDHERGFTFDVLGLVQKKEEAISLIERHPENLRTMIRAEVLAKEEALIISDDERFAEMFRQHLENIKNTYEDDKGIQDTREMSFLDDLRDPYYIDDVQVYLFKEELEPEICWIRIEGHDEHSFVGRILNEPDQDFDYHVNEEVIFALKKTQDETWMAICDLNPTKRLSRKDLEGGLLLKQAISDFNKNRSEKTLLEVMELLRDSTVVIPCTAILSQNDQAGIEKLLKDSGDDPESLTGKTITSTDQIRMVPDFLKSNDELFMPVFSDEKEMGEYGNSFSHVETEFLSAVELALLSDKKLYGIVVNPFSESFVVDNGLMEAVKTLKTRIVSQD